jgi:hypothetical protein
VQSDIDGKWQAKDPPPVGHTGPAASAVCERAVTLNRDLQSAVPTSVLLRPSSIPELYSGAHTCI